MTEIERTRAAQGDMRTIRNLVSALAAPNNANPIDSSAAQGMTPEVLRTWLDAAEAHRPRSTRSEERAFADHLALTAGSLVSLAVRTGKPWNLLLSHPVFASPVVTTPEPPEPQWSPTHWIPEPLDPDELPEFDRSPPPGQGAFEVAAFAVAVGLVPFLQTIATQAAQRAFDAARATIRERLRRGDGQISGPHLVIEERDGRVEFRVPSDIPDAALEALVALGEHGLESLAEPDPRGRAVTVAWNTESQSWERIVHR